jgi:hypothetical protein
VETPQQTPGADRVFCRPWCDIDANVLRISLLVIFKNRASTEWIMRQHVNAGWAVFTVAFLTLLTLTYNWMLQPKQELST